MNMKSAYIKQKGFTIVELLVVIVILGILAALIAVSYTGITRQALASTLQADLKQAATQIEIYMTENGSYPAEDSEFIDNLSKSSGTTYEYILEDGVYHLNATTSSDATIEYYATNGTLVVAGSYSGATSSSVVAWGGTNNEYSYSVYQTADDGYVVTGDTKSAGAGNQDMYVTKYSSTGSVDWSKTWGGTGYDYGVSVVQAPDNGYAVLGYVDSYGAGNKDFVLAKYTSAGTLSWNKTWGGTGNDYARGIANTSDNGYIVVGETYSFGAGNWDIAIAKFASDGTLSWDKTIGGTSYEYAGDIIQTSDGGYAVIGNAQSYGAGNQDIFLIKCASDGSVTWSKTWGGAGADYGRSVIQTSDGGYAVVGYTSNFGAGGNDAVLLKYTSDGTLSWNKTWGGAVNDYGYSLVQTSDGGYMITGETSNFGAGGTDMFIAKYTSDGTLSWSKTWGGASSESGRGIINISDGGYMVTGYTSSYGAGSADILMANYNSDGEMAGCSSPMCQSVTATDTSPSATVTSPSPTVGDPAATIGSPTASESTFTLTDTTVVATP